MSTTRAEKTGLLLAIFSAVAVAQSQDGGWRRLGDGQAGQGQAPAPRYDNRGGDPQFRPPAQLTVAPGTFLTVRVSQVISSDHNQQGDAFAATLVKPVVVDGVVVADRGQTIEGRVSEAQKAGHVKGTSRLGLELTDLTLVDGHQVPVRTQLVSRNGSTSVGRDAVAIGTTTAVGAAVGAAADYGRGAAIGAGAGAAAGIIGVLLTRGNATVVYPEQVLTFRLENSVAISTDRAPQAFRPVGPEDYQQPSDEPRLQSRPPAQPPYYGPGTYGPYWGYGSGWPYGYPSYYGPRIGIGFGYTYRGGFRGGGRRR